MSLHEVDGGNEMPITIDVFEMRSVWGTRKPLGVFAWRLSTQGPSFGPYNSESEAVEAASACFSPSPPEAPAHEKITTAL